MATCELGLTTRALVAAGLLWILAQTNASSGAHFCGVPDGSTSMSERVCEASKALQESSEATEFQDSKPASDNKGVKEGTATIALHVVDAGSGLPIDGAAVILWRPVNGDFDTATTWAIVDMKALNRRTNSKGELSLDVPAGVPQRLRIARPDHDEPGTTVDKEVPRLLAGETRAVKIEMPSLVDTVYYGRVVRETDSAPISGARVQLLYDFDKPQDGASRVPPEPTPEAQSDAAGYFQISAPFWKPYYGRIDAENHAPILFEMKAGHDTREKAATLSMPFGARIRVAVSRVDLSSAELTVRASVKSYEIARPSGASVILRSNPEWVVKTDKNGVGLLSGIPHTVPIALEVFDRSKLLRRERSALVLNPGEMRIVQIRVGDGVKVRGTAIDQDGQPITHNTVLLLPASDNAGSPPINTKCIGFIDSEDVLKEAKTDHRGRFYLDDIPPGSWWVGISPGRRWDSEDSADAVSPNATRVTIAPGAADVDVLLRAHRGLYIRGRVLQPDGRPSPNGQVFATIHEYESFDTFVKSDGSFALGPLSPGRFQVFASGSSRHVNSEPIEVDAGAQDVELKFRVGGSMRVEIVNETGQKCAATLSIQLVANESDRDDMQSSTLNIAPNVSDIVVNRKVAGTYDLVATTSDGKIGITKGARIVTGLETPGVVVTVRPTGSIAVRALDRHVDLHFQLLADHVSVSSHRVIPGKTVKVNAPPGEVALQYRVDGVRKERVVTVEAGKQVDVTLDAK